MRPKSILVTGPHRSGTTWVGRTLAHAPGTEYVIEPFNPRVNYNPYTIRPKPIAQWYLFVSESTDPEVAGYLDSALGENFALRRELSSLRRPTLAKHFAMGAYRYAHKRVVKNRAVIKDPIALFSAGWMDDRYDLDVIVMMRHPAAFVDSVVRRKWRFDFSNLSGQDALMDRLPEHARRIVSDLSRRELSHLEESALLWVVFEAAISNYRAQRPHWQFLRHEDVARAPVECFSQIFERCRLAMTEGVRDFIRTSTSDDNPVESEHALETHRHSRDLAGLWRTTLKSDEILAIRKLVDPVAGTYYDESDWAAC